MESDLECKHDWNVSIHPVGGADNTYLWTCVKCGKEIEVGA